MRTSYVKNGLVMVVILLFIGVAVQPSIAVNPISTENEDDCSICPKISKTHLVRLKRLINRAEILNNKISAMSKHNPKVAEKYQKFSDKIKTFIDMHEELNLDWDFPIICNILFILWLPFYKISSILAQILIQTNPDSLLWYLLFPIILITDIGVTLPVILMLSLNCIEFPDMFPE